MANLSQQLHNSKHGDGENTMIKSIEAGLSGNLHGSDADRGSNSSSEDSLSGEDFLTVTQDRTLWLIGLLTFQSMSSFILSDNEKLIKEHPVVVFFLTMLVGAGGNAGNQSAVRIIRGLATGKVTSSNARQAVLIEVKRAFIIGIMLTAFGCLRITFFGGRSVSDVLAITLSLFVITTTSIITGACLPLLLQRLACDPAHASTAIQVIMDISGVLITCRICAALLTSSDVLHSETGLDSQNMECLAKCKAPGITGA